MDRSEDADKDKAKVERNKAPMDGKTELLWSGLYVSVCIQTCVGWYVSASQSSPQFSRARRYAHSLCSCKSYESIRDPPQFFSYPFCCDIMVLPNSFYEYCELKGLDDYCIYLTTCPKEKSPCCYWSSRVLCCPVWCPFAYLCWSQWVCIKHDKKSETTTLW